MKKLGFTLIELMVTISIVGLLASVVLASLNHARKNAQDARIKSQLEQVRNAAAIYHDVNQTYGTMNVSFCIGEGSEVVATYCNCTGLETIGSVFNDTSLIPLVTDSNYPAGSVLNCSANNTSYVVTASLINTTGSSYWCVDSTGNSKPRNLPADADATSC